MKVPDHANIPSTRELTLPVQLFKQQSYVLPQPDVPIGSQETTISTASITKKLAPRHLCSFTYNMSCPEGSLVQYTGVFLMGDHALWILGSERGGVRIHRSQYDNVYAFTPTTMWQSPTESHRDFIMYIDTGPALMEWIEEYSTEGPVPTRTVKQGKAYSHIQYDSSLNLLLGAAALPSKFRLFDEDGNSAWEPDGAPPLFYYLDSH
jgi:cleavage and polyadenylation specificity factor subunit 1